MAEKSDRPEPDRSDSLPSGLRRSARLWSLPLGAAGRSASGMGRRLAGADAAEVTADQRRRAATHLFSVLGELKGGAMKVGQALSMFEGALPDEVAEPFRAELAKLQDAAPPMPTTRVHAVLTRELGRGWRDRFVRFDDHAAAAASIGQVHRGMWRDDDGGEVEVAVKVQYPGADVALRNDLRQMGRLSRVLGPMLGGMEIGPVIDELTARISEEVDYEREAASQQRAAEVFAGAGPGTVGAEFVVPRVLASTGRVLVSEWLPGRPLRDWIDTDRPAAERNRVALMLTRFLFAGPSLVGLLHADPHPGNFLVLDDGRLGIIDWGLVAEMPGGLPERMGALLRLAANGNAREVATGLLDLGFISPRAGRVDAGELLAYLRPFVEPAMVEEFHFSRDWMREQFTRVLHSARTSSLVHQLNLPPEYTLIHRVWMGGIAVLAQLDATAPFRSVMDEFLPGWR